MSDAVVTSLSIAADLIAVRHKNGSVTALIDRCNEWFKTYNESQIRDSFSGSSMLPGQLDLFDKARDRVRAVRLNCIHIIGG